MTTSTVTPVAVGALPPKSWSIAAWATTAAASVVLSYLLTLFLGLFFVGFGLLLLFGMSHGGPSILGILLMTFAFIVGGTLLWSLIPQKDTFEPAGVLVDLSKEGRLRHEITAIAQTMGERMPAEVYLVGDANAAVAQRGGGRFGFGSRRVLLIGLPLLQMLSISQFRAILAHEFAHFYAGDTRLGPWVFKARSSMAQVIFTLGQESIVLSFITRWAILALLHMIVVGGLALYWKLFARLTQYISRRQEFRCDELACHMAGSDNLAEGLCNVNRAAATFGSYWNRVVMPVAANGYHPPVADGFSRFLMAPAISKVADTFLAKRLATDATDHLDSHPPLKLRLQKARELAVAATNNDDRPAILLISDLQDLELRLLRQLAPNIGTENLKAMNWDSAGTDIYIPLWRKQTADIAEVLGPQTVNDLPKVLGSLNEIAGKIPDPAGTLLTRDQRAARAAQNVACALSLTLLDHGWHLHFQPGYFHVEKDQEKFDSSSVVASLQNGQTTAESWQDYCRKLGIGEWPLV